MPGTRLPKISCKGFNARLEMQHCSLLCWPMKRRAELTGYSQKISVSGWLVTCQFGGFKMEADRKQVSMGRDGRI